ncbi:MAG: LysM peptidoglycan-binding domain-containing protein [Bacteroidales bacterium]|nr:LysM peptidoglycan-binding domain-containing protein [Bacteroidales bacterium]
MKKRIIAIIMALACGIGPLYAQNVVKTETFISVNGIKMYLHKIRSGETIEAIAKAYNTTVQIISMHNQQYNGKFPEGIMLKIPATADNATGGSSQEFAYHQVEKKQSLYGIARKYGVSEDDIIRYNPKAKSGINVGEVLKIPVGNVQDPDRHDPNFVFHTVKQNESVNSICTLYKVDLNDFYKYNPKSKTSFKEGDVVVLPKSESFYDGQSDENVAEQDNIDNADLIRLEAAKSPDYTSCETYHYSKSKTIRVALMLPLNLTKNESLINAYINDPNKNNLSAKNTESIFEFYEGALMSIREFQLKGYNVQLDVYDTERSGNAAKMDMICEDPELKKADLIIGPLYTENVTRVAKFANENHIAMVSPFAIKNELLKDNPYLFQFTPSANTSIEETAEFFSRMTDCNLILLHSAESKLKPAEITLLRNYRNIINSINNLALKDIDFDNGGTNVLKTALNLIETNVIVVTSSDDEVFISKIINYLTNLQKNEKYKIVLLGSQSWEKINNIDVEFLQSMNFSYRSANFINYDNPKVRNFVSDFRDKFNGEPAIYGFAGYDICNYFVDQIAKKGKYFHFCPDGSTTNGLAYKFDFQKVSPLGGYENHTNFVLQYSERFTLEEVE